MASNSWYDLSKGQRKSMLEEAADFESATQEVMGVLAEGPPPETLEEEVIRLREEAKFTHSLRLQEGQLRAQANALRGERDNLAAQRDDLLNQVVELGGPDALTRSGRLSPKQEQDGLGAMSRLREFSTHGVGFRRIEHGRNAVLQLVVDILQLQREGSLSASCRRGAYHPYYLRESLGAYPSISRDFCDFEIEIKVDEMTMIEAQQRFDHERRNGPTP